MTVHREPVGPSTGREALLEALLVERFAVPVPEWHPPARPAEAHALRLVHDESA